MHVTGDEAMAEQSRKQGRRRPTMASSRKTSDSNSQPAATTGAPVSRSRRSSGRLRSRDSNVVGLGERARAPSGATSEPPQRLLPHPDPLALALPTLRHALLNRPLDEAARILAEGFVAALAPATAQVWIADPAPWSQSQRSGAQELAPRLRPYAIATASTRADEPARNPSGSSAGMAVPRHDALIDEVATTRRAVVLFDASASPQTSMWNALGVPESVTPFGTLTVYPLLARGQFLGVLALATRTRLAVRQLAALEELADLLALAADRDKLLSYSRSQEALAQTVVRHAPVAVAVLTMPDHVLALANPAFALLLGIEDQPNLIGRRLEDVVHERASSLAATLRLDAIYQGGEPQAMIELPIHHNERGMTYWNVTSSPLPGLSTSVGGVLVAAVDVTRQVIARHRAQEVAEVAQERIGQMMTLHATSLAVASQLGADPRELLADILRRSVVLLNARAGTVYVRDPQYDELEVVVCQGLRGDYTGSRIRVGDGLAGRVALTGQGLIVDDYRAYPFRAAIYDDEDFSAMIAVPLIHRGRVVGVLDVLDDAQRRTFSDDDLWLLDLFAAQAAQAIENARTYVELERAYQQQRELDRMKDDFIATASHELRTPLTGVQGFLELLLDYPGSRDEPVALDFLQKASDSALELAEISERLLQTSRLDTGHIELHMSDVRLAMVVEDVLRTFQSLHHAQGHSHELHAEVPPALSVRADIGRLREVLDNLVGNAIKYSPRGGRVTVRCVSTPPGADALPLLLGAPTTLPGAMSPSGAPFYRLSGGPAMLGAIEERPTVVLPHLTPQAIDPEHDPSAPQPSVIAAAQRQLFVVVYVSDEGMGIPDEERGRLFGRFARLDSARSSQIRGTGLGLYICRQIMRAMGGDVWLHTSVPGSGSTFAFALPAAVPASTSTAPEVRAAGDRATGTAATHLE
ncbi:MAG TPA: GAF domain-containing protein [Ktedonobacterales bacterium]